MSVRRIVRFMAYRRRNNDYFCLPRVPLAHGQIPVGDLSTDQEQYITLAANDLDHPTEIFQPVRRPHDVRMYRQRHDAHRIGVNLFELIERAVAIFRRLMMLDEHHGNVITLLRVRYTQDRFGARF
jgi:hypothetical protein